MGIGGRGFDVDGDALRKIDAHHAAVRRHIQDLIPVLLELQQEHGFDDRVIHDELVKAAQKFTPPIS